MTYVLNTDRVPLKEVVGDSTITEKGKASVAAGRLRKEKLRTIGFVRTTT